MKKRILLTIVLGFATALCLLAQQNILPSSWAIPHWKWSALTESFALGFAAMLLTIGTHALANGLNVGRYAWQRKLRKKLHVEDGKPMSETVWLMLSFDISLLCALPLVLLYVWGLQDTSAKMLEALLFKGFKIGGLHVVPGRWLLAVTVFVLLLTLTRWLKRKLEQSWLQGSKIERGGREAAITIFGYCSFLIAVLIALNITGLKLTNLAMLVSALSVGIGFGLQNIVNNFISGIILLFERPIRRGDTVTVGNTSGTVRSISIRSTEIETGDRVTVVVPNSDLISGQVHNWTLHDRCVRAVLPIGVAYGSDVNQVRNLLLAAANAHPEVIKPGAFIPGPNVLFMSFGESALNFELRLYVRDLDVRSQVISDLNFEIDRQFREHNISMPFPQREVWVRQEPGVNTPPEVAAASAV